MTEPSHTVCPRCEAQTVVVLAVSPVAGVWELKQCQRCEYVWRTTEPPRRSDPAHYPAAFRLTERDLRDAVAVPVVPPLTSSQ